jgi:hypothetical protein
MSELGIYPAGFWITELMNVHNALWSFYHDKSINEEVQKDIETLQNIEQFEREH